MKDDKSRVRILVSFSGQGGVERMILNLSRGMLSLGKQVELVFIKKMGEHIESIPKEVVVRQLSGGHTWASLPSLVRYLKEEKPTALLVAKDRAIRVAIIARWLSGTRFRLVGRLGTTVSAALKHKSRFRKWLWYSGMRFFYPKVDKIIAVSEGVKKDILNVTGMPSKQINVIRNPVCTEEIFELARKQPEHPWLRQKDLPVLLGTGRLTRQKDFPVLIRAFTLVRQQIDCRLLILGEGPLRVQLQQLTNELDVHKYVDMPGFAVNPYQYLANVDLFVLSSRWEGSPNVLTEALALGTPVVSTDCPSGPREILQEGKYGPLVKMGDVEGLANAILQTLDTPKDPGFLRESVVEYTAEQSAKRYLDALNL